MAFVTIELSLLLHEVIILLSPLRTGSSGNSKCLTALLDTEGVLLVHVEYVVVIGALKPNTLVPFCSLDFLLTIRGLCGGLPVFLGDLKTFLLE